MKLPWDNKYLKICFHVIFTVVVAYVLILLVNSAAFAVTNLGSMVDGLKSALSLVSSAFSVLIISFVIAYLLNPLVGFCQKKYDNLIKTKFSNFMAEKFSHIKFFSKNVRIVKPEPKFKKRTAGALLAYLIMFAVIILLGFALYIQVHGMSRKLGAGEDFVQGIKTGVDKIQNDLNDLLTNLRVMLEDWGVSSDFQDIVSNFIDSIKNFIGELSTKLLPAITSTGGKILNFFMALVIAFYFLRDKDYIKHKSTELLSLFTPERLKNRIMIILSDINSVFSGYVIGQITDALIMAVLLSVTLSIVGIDLAVVIGVFSGFSNIVPYFGAIIGFILSVSVALISGDVSKAIYAGVAVMVLQQIDGMFIVPKVVGKKVELGPAMVLLSLSVGGSLFGFAGMLFAVPVCAIIKLFFSKLIERQRERKAAEVLDTSDM